MVSFNFRPIRIDLQNLELMFVASWRAYPQQKLYQLQYHKSQVKWEQSQIGYPLKFLQLKK